jgi:hypothetical protein
MLRSTTSSSLGGEDHIPFPPRPSPGISVPGRPNQGLAVETHLKQQKTRHKEEL